MSMSSSGVAYSGGAVSALLAVLAIVDQSSAHWTRSDVTTHYGSYGLHPDPNLLTTLLAVYFFCAALVFALGGRAQSRGKKGTARALLITVAVCGLAFAALASLAAEYDGPVLVMVWRMLPWLVPAAAIAGLVAIKSPARKTA